jgi:hypothetical protein
MPIIPQVVKELQELFKAGATPSRLLLHIASRHGPEDRWRTLVQDYFLEAFAIPFPRVMNERERYSQIDLNNYLLNTRLLHQMVQTRLQWDRGISSPHEAPGSWLDCLVATDDADLVNQAKPGEIPEFSGCWPELDSSAQQAIQRLVGNSALLYERMLILARLVECLQRQVVLLEAQLSAKE